MEGNKKQVEGKALGFAYEFEGFPGGPVVKTQSFHCKWRGCDRLKHLPAYAEDLGSIPALGRYPGEGNGNPLQYSCLENPMN